MVKLVGMFLIVTGVVSLALGAFIDISYGSQSQITGSVIENIITQPAIPMGFYDYVVGITFSYSIISFIMGILFLIKM